MWEGSLIHYCLQKKNFLCQPQVLHSLKRSPFSPFSQLHSFLHWTCPSVYSNHTHQDRLWFQFTGFFPLLDHPPFSPHPPKYMKLIVHIYRYRFTEASTYIYIHTHFSIRYIFQCMFFIWSAVLWTFALTGNLLPSAEVGALQHSVLSRWAVLQKSTTMRGQWGQPALGFLSSRVTPQLQSSVTGDSSRCVRVWSHRHGGRGKPTRDQCPPAPCDVQG